MESSQVLLPLSGRRGLCDEVQYFKVRAGPLRERCTWRTLPVIEKSAECKGCEDSTKLGCNVECMIPIALTVKYFHGVFMCTL